MPYTEEQFNRLPKWAQAELKNAKSLQDSARRRSEDLDTTRELILRDSAQAVLDLGFPEDAVTWRGPVVAYREPYDKDPVPVARERDSVRFYLGESRNRHDWIDLATRRGVLQVMGTRGLFIRARSGNSVDILLDER
jgi:hypothetical protein